MRLIFSAGWALAGALWVCGCSSDSKGSDASNGGSGGSTMATNGDAGQAASAGDLCQTGCVETVAASCSNGPADQAGCLQTCYSLQVGKCGAEYATFQACAEGRPITCRADGVPIVAACSDEQAAFVACING